jgi:hypothetical protein
MKDPLTPEEHDEIINSFAEHFEKKYQAALSSSALTEQKPHSLMLAKAILFLTANDCRPLSDEGRKLVSSLGCLI